MNLKDLATKKIAIVGLGTNNQKLADFFNQQGIKFEIIKDWQAQNELETKLDQFEVIFRTPGLPYLSDAIRIAQKSGTIISSQTKLFFELCPAKIIGVTGTKGKGTTSSLIAKILQASGKKTWLAGNIGRDPFEFITEIKPEDWVVLELSSFQLQDLEYSPHIAVVLSITPDHLNYHADFDEYIKAKSNIIAHQLENDFAVLHPSLPDWFQGLGAAKKTYIDPKTVADYEHKLLGEHNLQNIAAATSVAKILEIPEDQIRSAVAAFDPLPHRLHLVRTIDGVKYIDDGFSTNIEPTIAAIDAFDSDLILVVGGSDKKLDYSRLGDKIRNTKKIKCAVIIGDVTDKILKNMEGFEGRIFTGAKNMTEIIAQARELAKSGDVILFSPGTASFGLFKNEHDRAEQFVNGVNSL